VVCPLCRQRKARRACPALGVDICSVCCATKRLIEIRCPESCPYLASAREHPPAALVRRQQRDAGAVAELLRDLNDRQMELFVMVATAIVRYQPPPLQTVADADAADAAEALAATFETASRGIIYDHRPGSRPAEQLAAVLRPALLEAGRTLGSKRIANGAREEASPGNPRAFLDLLGRVMRQFDESRGEAAPPDSGSPRLIVP
jgi:hypothetical protein